MIDGKQSAAGFSLIELLVAIAIFAVSAAGLVTLLTSSMVANVSSRNITTATQIAQDRIELMRSQAWDGLTAGSDTVGVFTRSWTVNTTDVANAATVAVTVTWNERGTRQVRLRTIMR